MIDLPQDFLVENYDVNKEFLENNKWKITAGAYLISIWEIVNNVQPVEAGAQVSVINYILGLIWGNDCIYLSLSHSKDENGNLSSSGRAVFLTVDTLYLLKSYLRKFCYNMFPLTLYLQLQFIKVQCTGNANKFIKYELKKKRFQPSGRKIC